MKNIIYGIIIIFLCAGITFGQTAGSLEDVTVTGSLDMEVESSKPQINIALEFDINKILYPINITYKDALNRKPAELLEMNTVLPEIVRSERTINAYLKNISSEPVIEFSFEQRNYPDVAKWELIISDAKGTLVNKFKGRKYLPDTITWTGRDKQKNMIFPGKWYSYILTITDSYGDIYTIPGQTFNFPAVFYEEKKYYVISLSNESVFDSGQNKIEITDKNGLLLKEAADIIKSYYPSPLQVTVYDKDYSTALKKAQTAAKYLSKILFLPENEISFYGEQAYISEYRIEILIYK